MKRNGFTLVELLAVIAILAILVIMALPAVLKMYSKARIDTFSNEVNTIARTAKQQYLLDGGKAQIYTNAEGTTNELNLSSNNNLKYLVQMDGNGNIIKLMVTNGEYQYSKEEKIDIADKDDVKIVSELTEAEKIEINADLLKNYVYSVDTNSFYIGSSIPEGATTFDNYQDAIASSHYNFFIRHTIDNDIITESYLGFIKDDELYYLRGGENAQYYDDNVELLNTIFNSTECEDSSGSYTCEITNLMVYQHNSGVLNGRLSARKGNSTCSIKNNGESYCLYR